MLRVMIFIDGTWLYRNLPRLRERYGDEDYRIDYGKLPHVLGETVAAELGTDEVDVVRTYLFGSNASNYDLRDEEAVTTRQEFFVRLKEEFNYEVEVFPVNFRGRRLRKADRDPEDDFEPKEKCVDIALATAMLYFAAIPHAYDIAVAVLGDLDFKPLCQHVRLLGKRVAIASIKGSCAPEFADPRDDAKVKDFPIIWLDDLLHKLELRYERHQLACQSPNHAGDRLVWTTYHPRRGEKFYCPDCMAEFRRQKQEAARQFVSSTVDEQPTEEYSVQEGTSGTTIRGLVSRKLAERGYGFIHGQDNNDYFFHLTDLGADLDFDALEENMKVQFEIRKEPSSGKAGAAMNVRRVSD